MRAEAIDTGITAAVFTLGAAVANRWMGRSFSLMNVAGPIALGMTAFHATVACCGVKIDEKVKEWTHTELLQGHTEKFQRAAKVTAGIAVALLTLEATTRIVPKVPLFEGRMNHINTLANSLSVADYSRIARLGAAVTAKALSYLSYTYVAS